jgi:hypothetical protein
MRKMKIRWFILTIAFLLTVSPPLNAQNKRASKYVVTFNSFGSLKIGMTVSKASKALGVRLLKEDDIGGCYYVRPKRGFKDIGFMVNNGSIARIDVSERTYATDRGAMVGDSEARIKRLYKGQYKVSKHFYTDGHNIEVKMKGGKFSIIFETDGKRVTYIRAGRSPEIQLVEGCS